MQQDVLLKIFELKGMIECISELANNFGEDYNYPMIEKLEIKINEIAKLVENDA